ncbi:MAG: redox-sensing transcriptional repressor Rex [Phycisphaerae bacterium]|nr:redox-sensing transcriptional repressor Rex [Phycisphaerae bacterium]
MPNRISDKTVARLSIYSRLLGGFRQQGKETIHSHDLALVAGVTPAQVRRDLMSVGGMGSPSKGYDVTELSESIEAFFGSQQRVNVALIGLGNIGRAILAYFHGRRPHLAIVAAFDIDSHRVDCVHNGCRCYPMHALGEIIEQQKISVGIIAVPVSAAQEVADTLVAHGIEGIMNFAPVPLRVPPNVYLEQVDITTSLETVAYFARQHTQEERR